nr:retrovirus-related Pol polyprotein from transposon TNT 1-94 [Tanacetum cinerariifolium]
MLKFNVEPIALRLLYNRTVHSDYLRLTQEQAVILREVVEHEKSQNPFNNSLEHACKYTKRIQELLILIRQTCPNINNSSDKLVAVTLKNKDKRVRFIKPITSSGNTNIKTSSSSNLVSDKPMLSSAGRNVWKLTGKVFTKTGYTWRPTGRNFTIGGNACPLTRISTTTKVPLRKPAALETDTPKPVITLVIQIVLWYLDFGCSKHMIGDRSQLTNFVNKFVFTVKFGNDYMEKIMGYGDYQIRNVTILRVYYVKGLEYKLFSVGQLCDSNLEVAFRQHTCFIRNLEGDDLLTGSRGNNLYTLSIGDMKASSSICLLSKASKTKSWLWHRRLSHLNFSIINHLAIHSLVRGLPKLKFEKDHLCSACAMGKSKRNPTNLNLKTQTKKTFISSLSMITLGLHGTDWDLLFQLLFDELVTSPHSVDHPAPEVIAPIAKVVALEPVASTVSPSSTTVNQDAPSLSNSQTTLETQSPVISNDVEEENNDIDVAHMNNDLFFGIRILDNDFESSSSDVIPTIVHATTPNSEHIEAMQEELYEFKRLEVWELVPHLDKVMVITLKWINKVKLDELEGILKNKARLVASGYHQEEEIDFEESFALVARVDALTEYGLGFNKISMYCDNKSAIALCCNNVQHSRSRDIDIRFHFIKEEVENEVVELYFVIMEYQLADIFTKALSREIIEFLINKLGIRSFTPETMKRLADEAEE